MTKRILAIAAAALAFAACTSTPPVATAARPSAGILAAVADAGRPQADKDRDGNRKPAETVAFAGVKPGDKVLELWPGGGYFTRILSKVVGDKGAIYALAPAAPPNAARDPAAAVKAIAASPGYGNVKPGTLDPAVKAAELADVVWTSQNYHDLHNRPNANLAPYNQWAFDSLKSGGIYLVLDHAAAAGSGKRDTATLHRIDPELVKSEVLAAGFRFVGESKALVNPADDHTTEVHNGAIRGTTDQFILKFRKP